MECVDKLIVNFISRHHVMTIATCVDGGSYCANLFYAYLFETGEDGDAGGFVFTSEGKTRHAEAFLQNPRVAASIVLETKMVGKIRGLQICGVVERVEEERYRKRYLKKFPYAVFADLELWILRPTFLKFTDNRLGFGKKIVWVSDENQE